MVAMDWGGCLWSILNVRPGKFVKKPLDRAFSKVERAGENKVAWSKATKSAAL
jgi:hypothetical protein